MNLFLIFIGLIMVIFVLISIVGLIYNLTILHKREQKIKAELDEFVDKYNENWGHLEKIERFFYP